MAKPKTDYPALLMVKRGRGFLPATQDDAERVDSYREGDLFWMVVSPKDVPWQIKKCKAVIRHAVKNCNTPWDNVDAADAALKLAVGWVMSYEDIDGSWRAYPKSMMEFEDIEELEALCEKIYALLYRITGVDPDVIAAECWSPPRDTSSSAGSPSSADDREPGEASPKPSTSPGPTSQASSAADRAPPESEPEGQIDGDDLSGAVEDLTTDEIEQRLGGQSAQITPHSIVLHMFRFVAQAVSDNRVKAHREENIKTLDDMAKGYRQAFDTFSKDGQKVVADCKRIMVNFLDGKSGFEWESVRKRVSDSSGLPEEKLEDL